MFTKGHGVLADGQRAMIVRGFRAPYGNPQRYLVEWIEDRFCGERPCDYRIAGEVMAFDETELHSDAARKGRVTR